MKFLEEKLTAFQVQAYTPEEAIQATGNLLVEQGYVEKKYVDAMIDSFHTNGPYIVVAPHIALPHARPEDGVKEACVSMIQLETPVVFGSEANDPVKLVFALGASDSNEHLEILKKLMALLGNQHTIEQLTVATSYESIKQYLK